ncbi:MAG: hypothetical protein QXD62_00215 [Candidatus Woesearchaeota archaeon]
MIQQHLEILKIREILEAPFVSSENEPNCIVINGKNIVRVLVYGVIINKFETTYTSILIDDGTSNIEVRVFENFPILEEIDVGDMILVIGKVREFGKKYISGEIIKKIESDEWLEVLERMKVKNKEIIEKPESVQPDQLKIENNLIKSKIEAVEEIKVEDPEKGFDFIKEKTKRFEEEIEKKNKLLSIIKENDDGSGADYNALLEKYPFDDLDEILFKLLESGDIYEFRPKRYKILD